MGIRDFVNSRSIRANIMVSFVLLSIIFIGGTGGLSYLLFKRAGDQTITDSVNALESQILDNIEDTAAKNAEIIEEKLSSAEAMVRYMGSELEYVFSAENRYGDREVFYDYWFDDVLGDPLKTPADTQYDSNYGIDVSWEYASYYYTDSTSVNYETLTALQNYTLETVANMDYAFQNVHSQAPDFRWLYATLPFGTGIDLFINFPGSVLLGDDAERISEAWQPSTDDWYIDVNTGSYEDIVFTAPYYDPIDQVPLITIGRNVRFANGSLIGVICGDISIETMVEKITNITILDTGFASLITSDGSVIAHPTVTPTGEDFPILGVDAESGLNSTAVSIITSATQSGILRYTQGTEERYLAYVPVGKGDYISIIILSVDEALEGIEPVENRMLSAIRSNLNTIWIIVGISFAIGITVGLILTAYITKPFTHLIQVARTLSTRRARKDIEEGLMTKIDPDLLQSEDELGDLTRAFKDMIDSVQQAEREKED